MFPILVRLSLGRSPTFFNDNGQKAATRGVERETPVPEGELNLRRINPINIGVILSNTMAL